MEAVGLADKANAYARSLSGGMRRRLLVGKAMVHSPPVLILDEATSHLDALSEQGVRKALDQLKADRTTIIIAHRLSTIRDADMIVVPKTAKLLKTAPTRTC